MEEKNIEQFVKRLATTNTSTEEDSRTMQNLLRYIGLNSAVVTTGVVYPTGFGLTVSIHQMAEKLCEKFGIEIQKEIQK